MNNEIKKELEELNFYVSMLNHFYEPIFPSSKDREIKEDIINLIELTTKEIKNLIL